MRRDGASTSLWQDGMLDYIPTSSFDPGRTYDVIIVGGGATGITTALQLQKAGKKCLVAEAYNLCFGTTGGTTAHLNTILDTPYDRILNDFGEDAIHLVASATKKALSLYASNVKEYNIDCGYEQKDGYVYAQTDKQAEDLDKLFTASVKAGVDVAYTDTVPVPITCQKAIVFRNQAQLHASRYVYALAKAFEEAGGVIVQNCRVNEVVETGEGVVADTTLGGVKASYLVYATHIPPGINLLHFRCAPYRSYAIAVELEDAVYFDGLSYDMYDPYHYYRTQEVDGKRYFIIGGEDHKTAHQVNTEACFAKLEAHARKYFKVSNVPFRWSSQYFEPSDGLAYIGLLPGCKGNILVATGYSGNGMTYSHISALVLTDMIMHKENAYEALFNPNRIKPVAGFAAFVRENADVVREFVEKRFSYEKLKDLADMAPGEAKLVKYEGKKIGLYKNANGQLYAVNPVCSHARCVVDWNNAERSWDCPCHGARYDIYGQVLTGPARHGLEVVEIKDLMKE